MTFHRTCGTGGTRNSRRERHNLDMPNFNKSTSGGFSRPPRKGKKKLNPPTKGKTTPEQRYKRMMSGQAPRKTIGEEIGSRMIGRSKVTGRY